MPSQFGGIAVNESIEQPLTGAEAVPASRFGGVAIDGMEQVNIPKANNIALNNVIDLNSDDPEIAPLQEESNNQKEQMLQLAESRFSPETIQSWENNPIEFGEAFSFLEWSDVTPLGGIATGVNAIKLANISGKLEEGKEISEGEQSTLDEYINKTLEMNLRGMSYGGKIAYYGSPLPAFMLEFAATMGVGKAAQAATVKAITKGVEVSVLKAATTKAAGRVARVVTQSAAMVPMTVRNYGDQRLGPWTVTDKGQLIFKEATDSPAMSALKAYAYTSVEVASELSGATLGKYIINPVTKKLSTPLINGLNALPANLKEGLFRAYKSIKPNATISKAFTRGGWNGMIAELGEERVADVLRETVNLTLEDGYTFDQVIDGITPSKDQLLLEAGLIGTMGGIKTSANIGANLFISRGSSRADAESAINSLGVIEQEAIIDSQLQVDTTPYIPVEEALQPDRPSVKSTLLQEYDQYQQAEGEYTSLVELKEAQVKQLEIDLYNAKRKNTPLGKVIAKAGGINIDSAMSYMGWNKADLTAVNKALSSTVFRVKGGMQIDELTRSVESEYWSGFDMDMAETDLANVMDVIDEIRVNPKLPAFSEQQALVEEIDTQLTSLQSTESDVLDQYYKALQEEVATDDKVTDQFTPAEIFSEKEIIAIDFITEKESVTTSELQLHLKSGYNATLQIIKDLQSKGILSEMKLDTVNQKAAYQILSIPKSAPVSKEEFDRINTELEDFIQSQETTPEPIVNPIVQSQTDAFEASEPTAIAPNQSIFKEWYYNWWDTLGALTDVSIEAGKRVGVAKAGERLQILVRQFAGVVGMATSNITAQTYIINPDGNVEITGNGLKPILEDFDNSVFSVEPNKKQRKQDFTDYLIAVRIFEDLQDREDVDVSEKQKLDSVATLTKLAEKYGDNFIWFKSSAQEVYAFQRRILQNLVSSGNISQEQYDAITKANPNYIPFQRVMDEDKATFGAIEKRLFTNATAAKVIRKIRGSDKDIKDPINSIMLNTFKILDMSWQNRIANTIANLETAMPEYIQSVKTPMQKFMVDGKAEYRPSELEPKGTITVYVEGKKKYYKVAPPMLKALEQLRPAQIGFIEKIFSVPATVLRAGATLVPEFWARNVLRDLQSSFIQSTARPTPIDAVAGLTALMGKADLHAKWMQSGGSFNSYMELSDNGMAKAQKELLSDDGKLVRFLKNPLTLPSDISLGLEQSVRLGVYKAAKAKGMSDIEAGFEARDATLDFARGGRYSKVINKYVPFFNAGMQGADKLVRTMKSNPVATTMWATATITMPSLLIAGYYLFGAPEEERKEYLEIPQWQKDMFWVFKKDGVWMRYPKPFSLGFIFGSVPERFLAWTADEDIKDGAEFWGELVKGVIGSVSPIYDPSAAIPPLIKVAIEDVTNYNFFQGRRLHPDWMDDLAPEERKTKGTSETAVEVGKLLGVSPAKVDNTLRGLIAGSAQYVTGAGDAIINAVKEYNGEDIPAKPTTPTDTPLLRAFTMQFPSGSRAESTQEMYDLLQLGRQANNTWKKLKGDEKQKFREENRVILNSLPALESSSKQMAKLNKRRNKIYEDVFMSGSDKEAELRILDDQILERAKRGNTVFLNNLNDL